MQPRLDRQWIGAFLIGSLLVHSIALAHISRPSPIQRPPWSDAIELEIRADSPQRLASIGSLTLTANVRSENAGRPAVRVRTAGPVTSKKQAVLAMAPDAGSEPVLGSAGVPPNVIDAPIRLDLSARRVAQAWTQSGMSSCDPLTSKCVTAPTPPTAAQTLDASLRASAGSSDYLAPRRRPSLLRASDGTYHYDGPLFSARIDSDGAVHFTDHVVGRRHPRRDREIDSAEKLWFLAQTEELRKYLTDRVRAEWRMRTRRALEDELETIVSQRGIDASVIHRRILSLWLDCGADEDTARARPIVEDFVRSRMPQTGRLGFTQGELDTFNRGRPDLPLFSPYSRGARAEPVRALVARSAE